MNLHIHLPIGIPLVLTALGWLATTSPVCADEIDEALAIVARSGPDGAGAAEARVARERLGAAGIETLPRLLKAMNTTNVVAANYVRSAWDQIVARELAAGRSDGLPRPALEAFVRDAANGGRPRRLALELLGTRFRDAQLPQWLDDPEFRDNAVAYTIGRGDAFKKADDLDAARQAFRQAFEHARDSDQVLQAVARLQSVGVVVDPAAHLGFVTRWYLCGPFDAPETTGFTKAFPPEQQVDLTAEYSAADGAKFGWRERSTRDALGQFNLIQDLAAAKEAVGYAYCELRSPRRQAIQLRCSADDNLSVWLNGRPVLAREQWLNGTRLDRFITPVTLDEGIHRVLVKICQGPQHVDPAVPNNWSFQLRFCGTDGAGAAFEVIRPAAKAAAE